MRGLVNDRIVIFIWLAVDRVAWSHRHASVGRDEFSEAFVPEHDESVVAVIAPYPAAVLRRRLYRHPAVCVWSAHDSTAERWPADTVGGATVPAVSAAGTCNPDGNEWGDWLAGPDLIPELDGATAPLLGLPACKWGLTISFPLKRPMKAVMLPIPSRQRVVQPPASRRG